MKTLIGIFAICIFESCGNSQPEVRSPFSHLDTVQTKAETTKEIDKPEDGIKSPFSGLDKK